MDDDGRIDGHPHESPGLYSNSYALSNEPMNDVMAIVANPEGFSTRSSHDSVDRFSKRRSSLQVLQPLVTYSNSKYSDSNSSMDDILAVRSTQDGSSVQLSSLDFFDRLSEIHRHGPELGEQEQAAIDKLNFGNGDDTRHCEISCGPPPIAPKEVVASPAPQVGTTSSRSRHTSLPPPMIVGLGAHLRS